MQETLTGIHPKRSIYSPHIKHKKVWQQHDIGSFTGQIENKENNLMMYSFKLSDDSIIKSSSLYNLLSSLQSKNPIVGGDTSEEAKKAFPFKCFNNLKEAMESINFQFTEQEKSYYNKIEWKLEDSISLSYTVEFDDVDKEWNFLECHKQRNFAVVMDNSRAIFDFKK